MAGLNGWGMDPALFRAMAHPLRVQILGELSLPGAVLSPSRFAEDACRPLSTVSYHFRALAKFGLIECVNEETVRGSVEHFYRASKRALFTDRAWKGLPGAARTQIASKTLSKYIEVSQTAIEGGAFERRDNAHFSWGTMEVDEQGWVEMQERLSKTLAEMLEIGNASAARVREGASGFHATYALGGFESPTTYSGNPT